MSNVWQLKQDHSKLPSDAIIVDEIELPKKRTLIADVKNIIAKFYWQEFTYLHVYACALKMPDIQEMENLQDSVRWLVNQLYRDGHIELVKRGGPGVCSVYRNKQQ